MIKIPFCFMAAGICLLRAYDFFEAGFGEIGMCFGMMGIGGVLMSVGFLSLQRRGDKQ